MIIQGPSTPPPKSALGPWDGLRASDGDLDSRWCDDREIRRHRRQVPSEFLDLNHTSKSMILVSFMILKFAPEA
jgi:hypothetical protein